MIQESFTKICRHIPVLVKIEHNRALCMKTYMSLLAEVSGRGIPPGEFIAIHKRKSLVNVPELSTYASCKAHP
jgi:hypothetical protein